MIGSRLPSFEGSECRRFDFLLVEDDPNAVLLFRRALAKVSVPESCHVVGDGQAAIEYLSGFGRYQDRKQFPLPCLVLLDLHLPGKSGLEVLKWLKGNPRLRPIPAIMLTTSSDPADVKQAVELGASAYWVKPLDLRALERIARKVMVFLTLFCNQIKEAIDREDGDALNS